MPRLIPALGLAAALALAAFHPVPAAAQFDDQERRAIEEVVRAYLLENPEVLIEALQEYQARQELAEATRQQQAVSELASALFDGGAPDWGPADASVVLVEFFDYNCGFCKRSLDDMRALMETEDDLRIVFLEIPILSPSSHTAARAALASRNQGLYLEMHDALMSYRGQLTDEIIFQIAAEAGADIERLRADMESNAVLSEINRNLQLAEAIGVRGTPAFVIGDRVIPGAVGLAALQNAIDLERERS